MSDIACHSSTIRPHKVSHYFLLFCLIHTLVWTLLPLYFRSTLPADVAEGIAWGMQMQWGYHKHPPFTAWFLAFFAQMGGFAEWAIYLCSQMVVLVTFFSIWRLASWFLPALQAFMSVLLLEGVVFFNVKTDELTPDTMQTPVWALVMLIFYTALTRKKYWPLVGFLCGIAVLTKYSAILLFIPMLVILLGTAEGRSQMKTWGPYVALLVFLLVIAPHVWWAWDHGFQAMNYASDSFQGDRHVAVNIWGRLLNPLDTLGGILLTLIPLGIMLLAFHKQEKTAISLNHFQKVWLLVMGFGPLIVALIFSLATGIFIRHRWLTPCYLLMGLMAIAWIKPADSRFIPFLKIFAVVFVCIPMVRFGNMMIKPYVLSNMKTHSYYLPVSKITDYVSNVWYEETGMPLSYVGGENYLTTFMNVYSKDNPRPLLESNFAISPWIDAADFRKRGAMFVWYNQDAGYGEKLKKEYPGLIVYPPKRFKLATKAFTQPLIVGIALLPPTG